MKQTTIEIVQQEEVLIFDNCSRETEWSEVMRASMKLLYKELKEGESKTLSITITRLKE